MFLDFYQLKEQPFGVTPDPRYLYLGESHREALASLFYGVNTGRGLLALIAPPGMGKTTLLFRFLERLRRSARTAFLFQTQCDSNGLLHYMLRDLGINTQGQDFVTMHDRLNTILLQEAHAGRRFVLVIDEAQNLSDTVLETARLLSDFETPNEKLLQIVFAGQPQLAEKLDRPELVQLRQRISILGRLRPFNPTEVNHYIHHRLQVAGHSDEDLFTPAAVESVAFRSQGIPRNINNICFNALSLGCALGRKQIDVDLIEEVTGDLELSSLTDSGQPGLRSIDLSPEPQTQDPIGIQGFTPASTVPSQSQAADGGSDLQDDAVGASEDKGTLVLEILELAEQRGAEILAEVVDSDSFVEEAVLRTTKDRADIRQEPEPWMEDAPDDAILVSAVTTTLTPTDQRGGQHEGRSGNLMRSTSTINQSSGLLISYASEKESKVKRWALVAAIFVLIALAALFYRQDLRASATHTRQTLIPTMANLSSSFSAIGIEFKPPLIPKVKSALAAARVVWGKRGLFLMRKPEPPPLTDDNARLLQAPDGQRPPIMAGVLAEPPAPEQARFVSLTQVIVRPNDDLRQICLRYLGKFDQHVVEEIHELNPDMADPNQVIVGQHIVLPGSKQNNHNHSAVAKSKP